MPCPGCLGLSKTQWIAIFSTDLKLSVSKLSSIMGPGENR
ncbi:conserved hypothetical protein, partial [delta proteobacterium NaphS2]